MAGGVRAERAPNWVAAWTASAHGPYPVGNPTAPPDMRFALPSAETGARDQTFRLIVRPESRLRKVTATAVVQQILTETPVPSLSRTGT